MFKKILVAIDGSATSNRGFNEALALAKDQGATLHVLHVIDEAPMISGYEGATYMTQGYVDQLMEGLRNEGTKILNKARAAAQKEGYGLHAVLAEARGEGVAHAILSEAHKLRVDLIVLGTHGRRGLRRLVMGSDAEMVVREATVPVLLVRATPSHRVRHRRTGEAEKAAPREKRVVESASTSSEAIVTTT